MTASLSAAVRVVEVQALGEVEEPEFFSTLNAVLLHEARDLRAAAVAQQHVHDLDVHGAQCQVHRCVHVVVLAVDISAGF